MNDSLDVLVGDFDDESALHLTNLVSGAPVKFLDSPKVFFSIPKIESVSDIARPYIDVVFDGNDTLLNTKSSLSELIIYVNPVDNRGQPIKRNSLGTFSKFSATSFRPYFCWILDPNRSLRVKRYCTSVIQSLASDKTPLRLTPFLVSASGPTASRFNRATESANPPNIYSE